MALAGVLRRIDRGLYDKPVLNPLTKRPTTPDYRAVVDAIARRDRLRMLVDGMTAANDLGLTDAVPARVVSHRRTPAEGPTGATEYRVQTDRAQPPVLGGRPAMRIVQALYWLKYTLASERESILARLAKIVEDSTHGSSIRRDLIDGFGVLPAWMQGLLRELPGWEQQAFEALPVHEESLKTSRLDASHGPSI